MQYELFTIFKTIPNFDTVYMTHLVYEYARPIPKYLYTHSFAGKAFSLIAEDDEEAVHILYKVRPALPSIVVDPQLEQLVRTITILKSFDLHDTCIDSKITLIKQEQATTIDEVVTKDRKLEHLYQLKHFVWCKDIIQTRCHKIPLHNNQEVKSELLIYIPVGYM